MTESNHWLAQVDVLVMAAGTGSRMGMAERKQWLTLCGSPLFVYTLQKFRDYGADSLSVVIHSEDRVRVGQALLEAGLADVGIVTGGETRQASVRLGLAHTGRDFVAVHDGARPFLERADFERVVKLAQAHGAATLGAPVRDTLKRVNTSGHIQVNVDREGLWAVYTPQVFRRDWLQSAHQRAHAEGFVGTDDTVLLERMGHLVEVAAGSPWNVKITEQADLQWIRWWEMAMCESD